MTCRASMSLPSVRAAPSTTSCAAWTASRAAERSASGTARRLPSGSAGDDGHERRENDGVVAWVNAGKGREILGDGPRSGARLRLGPGVDDVEARLAHQRRKLGAHV